MLTGGRGFFWQRYTLKTRFANVAGLKAGSPVRVAGVEVGTVTDVEFVGEQVDVDVRGQQERSRPQITDASIATLGSVSLLGESAVDITPVDATARRFRSGATCRRATPPAQFADITDQASQGIERAHRADPGHPRRARARSAS